MSSSHQTNTNSETDIPIDKDFGYAPEIFTMSKFQAVSSTSETN